MKKIILAMALCFSFGMAIEFSNETERLSVTEKMNNFIINNHCLIEPEYIRSDEEILTICTLAYLMAEDMYCTVEKTKNLKNCLTARQWIEARKGLL